ncbi:outer membrane protein assembly factor BamB family protein [Micromonospora sp. NPDC003197]
MAIIDLGERNDELSPDTGPRPPQWITARWPRVGTVLIVLLATVAASAPASSLQPELVIPAGLASRLTVDRDQLYVVEKVDVEGQITARRVTDGRVLWQVPSPVQGQPGIFGPVGGTLILTGGNETGEVGEIAGLDRASGSLSWRYQASMTGVGISGELLLWTGTVRQSAPSDLFAVDPATGAIRWTHPVPANAQLVYDYQRERLSLIALGLPTGRVEVRDVGSAGLRGAVDLPAPPPHQPGEPGWTVNIVDDLLLVFDGRGATTAYGLDRLDLRWTIPDNGRGWMSSCGGWLCASSLSDGIQVYDRSTGQPRWADRRWPIAWPVGDHLVAVEEEARRPAPLVVLDLATGHKLGDLGRWELIPPRTEDRVLIGLRVAPDGRAWVARLDPATRTVRILAVLRDISGDCDVYLTEKLVGCRQLDGALAMWRLSD